MYVPMGLRPPPKSIPSRVVRSRELLPRKLRVGGLPKGRPTSLGAVCVTCSLAFDPSRRPIM